MPGGMSLLCPIRFLRGMCWAATTPVCRNGIDYMPTAVIVISMVTYGPMFRPPYLRLIISRFSKVVGSLAIGHVRPGLESDLCSVRRVLGAWIWCIVTAWFRSVGCRRFHTER